MSDQAYQREYYRLNKAAIRAKQQARYIKLNPGANPRKVLTPGAAILMMPKPQRPARKPGTLWRGRLGHGSEYSGERSVAGRAFAALGRKISNQIFRDGPWPTAVRLSNTSFINRSQA